MKAKLPRDPFLGALQVALSVVSGARTDRAVLQDVKLTADKQGIRVSATDYELALRVGVPEGEVLEPGVAVVPAARLVAILRESEAPAIECHTDGAHLTVQTPTARYTIFGTAPEEFPEIPEPDASGGITVERPALREMIRRTTFAAATERSRYTLNGVRWQGVKGHLRLVATDGRRLAFAEHKVGGKGVEKTIPPAIVPLKAMAVLEKLLGTGPDSPVTCKVVENRIVVTTGDAAFSALLLEGQFPEYEGVIRAAGAKPAALDAAGLLRAVRQAVPLTDQDTRTVRVKLKPGGAVLRARSAGTGGGEAEVEVALKYDGPEVEIAFDATFLGDALRAIGTAEATLDVAGPSAAAVLRAGEGYVNVIMPITLAEGA